MSELQPGFQADGIPAGGASPLAVQCHDGYRESKQSWRELLVDLQSRGFRPPAPAVGDGALGLWAAPAEVYPTTRTQRCRVHKMANILNKLPKGVQARAKQGLQAIRMAESRAAATRALNQHSFDRKERKKSNPG